MTLNEALEQNAKAIRETQAETTRIAGVINSNFQSINTYQQEVSEYLKKNQSDIQSLTALVQVLREEVLEVRKMLGPK